MTGMTRRKVFETHLFWIAVPIGLVAIVLGAFISRQAIGTGLMFGGIFSLSDTYFNYWSELANGLKFGSLLAAFVVAIVVGYRKIEGQDA